MRHGFTLIELMIAVAIIAMLACAAVPLYNGYINEASQTEARSELANMASKEEAYHSSWGRYIAASTENAYPSPEGSFGTRSIQSMTQNDAWTQLGYEYHTNAEGGLFSGPVYFKYQIAVDDAGSQYLACAHRLLSPATSERITLRSTNRRAFITDSENACDLE